MANACEDDQAIATLNGTDLGGRTLTIKEAKPKVERPRGAAVEEAAVLVAEAGATTIAAIGGNRAGSFFRMHKVFRSGDQMPVGDE